KRPAPGAGNGVGGSCSGSGSPPARSQPAASGASCPPPGRADSATSSGDVSRGRHIGKAPPPPPLRSSG
ncbi:hypothetical protein P7K49_004585, partial [Saguinus oedipus]